MMDFKEIPGATQSYITDVFNRFLEQAYDEAKDIVVSRASARDIIPIWEKLPFGDQSYTTFIYHKACRVVSMILSRETTIHEVETCSGYGEVIRELQALEAKIDDELLDIMNYAAFQLAARRAYRYMTSEENAEECPNED